MQPQKRCHRMAAMVKIPVPQLLDEVAAVEAVPSSGPFCSTLFNTGFALIMVL
jgi:hypothetical protein